MERAYQLCSQHSGQSFSQALGPSFRQAVSAVFADERMSSDVMLAGHLQATLQRAKACGDDYLVAVQDTTFYNYTTHPAMQGLGDIQPGVKGIIQHNVLLLNHAGLPLGLLDQQYWSRQAGDEVAFEGKESLKWANGLKQVNKHLGTSGKKVVVVQDREADIFSFFKHERKEGIELLVRVHQPRNLQIIESGQVVKLVDARALLAVKGTTEVSIIRDGKAVTLTLSLQAGGVQVLPDKDLSPARHKTQALSLVIAREVGAVDEKGNDVFKEEEVAEWYLLTSLPSESVEEIERIVNFYGLRWRIERLHYTLKSGALKVEKLQFDDIETMINALSFYSVVGWRLLALTYQLREDKDAAASTCYEPEEIKLLEAVSKKEVRTVGQATLAMARLVNFVPSKKQPMPGIKVLGQAIERFYYVKVGAMATSS